MAGLINQAMKDPTMGQSMGQDEQDATPEEQAQYERIVMAALTIIYDDNANQQIIKMMSDMKGSPVEALVQTANTVLGHVSEKSGGVSPDILIAASEEVLSALAELADKAGIFAVDDQVVEQASMQMAQTLVNNQAGVQNGQQIS